MPDPAESRLAEVVAVLSMATDLGTGQPMERGIRTCLAGVKLAELLGLDAQVASDIYYTLALSALGCTADSRAAADMLGDEVDIGPAFAPIVHAPVSEALPVVARAVASGRPLGQRPWAVARFMANNLRHRPALVQAHCEVAQQLAQRLLLGRGVVESLGCIFERWDGAGMPRRLRGEAIPLPARIAHLTYDIELFQRTEGPAATPATIQRRRGRAFDPRLVQVFVEHAAEVLAAMEAGPPLDAMLAAEPQPRLLLSPRDVDAAAEVIADFADLKSAFFAGHSRRVAELAHSAARVMNLPAAELRDIRRAGLVHDLGRVSVSTRIWEYSGGLGSAESEKIRLHAYYSERVVGHASCLKDAAALAGRHHERLDGHGYHRGERAPSLSPAARALAVADVFAALTEPRPHRPAFPAVAAANILRQEAAGGRLDSLAVEAVLGASGQRAQPPAMPPLPADLTEREAEVLGWLARGLTTKEIGQRLGITPKTADHHVQHVYAKIGVRTRAAATVFAMQHNLVPRG
jgi:HD-GYP domain-containing protein (c-di-GMP phosphodiesterase class II)